MKNTVFVLSVSTIFFSPLFISFTDPLGHVHPEINNKNGNPNYKYFYSNAEHGNSPDDHFSVGGILNSLHSQFKVALYYKILQTVLYEQTLGGGEEELPFKRKSRLREKTPWLVWSWGVEKRENRTKKKFQKRRDEIYCTADYTEHVFLCTPV